MDQVVIYIVTTIIGIWLSSVEWRLKTMKEKVETFPDRNEVKETIDMKQEAVKLLQQELKEDISRIDAKIDKLIDLQMRKS